MKIALVVGNDATEDSRIRWKARSLAAAGHRVTVYGVLSPATEAEDDEAGVVYVRVAVKERPPLTGLARPLHLARWYERFRPVVDVAVKRETPEAIHAHDLDVAGPAQQAALALGVPFVLDVAGAPYVDRLASALALPPCAAGRRTFSAAEDLLRRKGAALETRLRSRGLAATVVDTHSLGEEILRRYGGSPPVVVRSLPPYRAPKKTDALRRRLGAFPTERLLLLAGPLDEGCGVDAAVRALKLLGRGYVLVLLGATPRLAAFERIAEDERVAAQVRYVPAVPDTEAFELTGSADVALVPTEPCNAVSRLSVPPRLFQALAAGVPIVASDTAEAGSIIRATGAGVLYPARSAQDPAALAEGIHTILSDGSLARTCAQAARHAARTQFNWETESRRLVDLYDEIERGRSVSDPRGADR